MEGPHFPPMNSPVAILLIIVLSVPITLSGKNVQNLDSDSLSKELKKDLPDSTKVGILIDLSESREVGQDSAKLYILEALALSQRIHYKFGMAQSYHSLIFFAKNEAEIDSLMKLSTQFFNESNHQQYQSLVFLKAASRYLSLGNSYGKAFHYACLFLSSYKNDEDSFSCAKAWNIIGEVYRISKNYSKAQESYLRAKKYSVARGQIIFLSPFINIGTVYLETAQLDSAMSRYDFVQKHLLKEGEGQSNTFAYIKYRKAQVFLLQGNFEKALNEGTLGFELYDRLGHNEGRVLTLGIQSEIYFKQQLYRKAILYGKQSIDLATSIEYMINGIDKVCETVAKSYSQLGEFENAYRYESIQNQLKSKLYDPSVTAALVNELMQLEVEKQKLQQKLVEEQKLESEAIVRAQRLLNILALAGVLVLATGCFLFYRNAKAQRKMNAVLQENQEEIMTQTEELTAQTEELKVINEKNEEINANLEAIVDERTRVIKDQNFRLLEYAYFNAHKVRGPLARILGLISIIEFEFPDDPNAPYRKMLKDASEELDSAIGEINTILETPDKLSEMDTQISSPLADR